MKARELMYLEATLVHLVETMCLQGKINEEVSNQLDRVRAELKAIKKDIKALPSKNTH